VPAGSGGHPADRLRRQVDLEVSMTFSEAIVARQGSLSRNSLGQER